MLFRGVRDLLESGKRLLESTLLDQVLAVLDGFGRIELPANGARAGYLGHVSFLALNAHPVFSSPTLRGIFVREVLLCDTVPLPPSGLNTALPPPSGKARTLRERLDEHMADPSCKGCHSFIDKIGYGFEEFNGIGRYQDKDNGQPIDASGSLDNKAFNNARELGKVIAHSDKFRRCVTEKLYSYAIGRSPSKGEHGEIDRLVDGFADDGYRLKTLFAAIATSEGFRTLAEVK